MLLVSTDIVNLSGYLGLYWVGMTRYQNMQDLAVILPIGGFKISVVDVPGPVDDICGGSVCLIFFLRLWGSWVNLSYWGI